MPDKKLTDVFNDIKVGDICIYHYADGNGSVNIVEVVEVLDSDISKIKCVQVISDKSGNGWFEYLYKTGHTMNASNKYLNKIYCNDLINRLQAENEELIHKLECLLCHATGGKLSKYTYPLGTMESYVNDTIQDYCEEAIEEAKAEAYKEFAEKLKKESTCPYADIDLRAVSVGDIDNLLKELVGGGK